MQSLRHRQALAATEGVLRQRPLDFGGGEAHPVALVQHLVGGDGQAVDADQVVVRFEQAKQLEAAGLSRPEIACRLKQHPKTIQRYLRH